MPNRILTPDFDPSSLKVLQLRGILFDHNVSFPSNAKKKDLVQIFEKHVRNSTPASPSSSKPRELVIVDVGKLPSSPVIEDSKLLIATPVKAANSSRVSSARKSGSKRKLMFSSSDNAVSEKGNVFQVDSDSDTEILSPRKKPKRSRTSTPQKQESEKPELVKTPKSERKTPKPTKSTKTPQSKTPRATRAESATPDTIRSPSTSATPTLKKAAKTQSKTSREKSSTPRKSPILTSSNVEDSMDSTPEINPEVDESPNSPILKAELPNSSKNSSWQNSFQTASAISDLSVDNAQSFDLALAKLKKEDEHFNESIKLENSQDADLAKLLGIDVTRVKPKPKGRRVISPRNPIIIPRRRLEYKEELSGGSETEKEASAIEEESDKAESDEDSDDESSLESEDDDEEDESPELADQVSLQKEGVKIKRGTSKFGKSLLWGLFYIFAWSILAGGALFTYWYREQTFLVGYCGHEIYKTTIPNTPDAPRFLVEAGAYLDENFRPQCVECPQHARCFANLEIGCYDDFVEFTPWYFSYLPVVDPHLKKCVPDTKKAEKIEIMIDVALDLLRSRNAHKNCGRLPEDDDEAGIEIGDLHDLLLAMKAPYITLEEFEELWERSVEELQKEPEIIVRQVTSSFPEKSQEELLTSQVRLGNHHVHSAIDANDTVAETEATYKVLRSTSLSHISLKCQLSNTMISIVVKFKTTLLVLTIISVILLTAQLKYKQFRLHQQKIDTLYREVLNKLQRQARLSSESAELPAYIGSIQLRDLILSDETNLARKTRLWEAVSRKVDRNTNVKHQLLEIHGEVMKVWQWISLIE